jgi:hypothetical protein
MRFEIVEWKDPDKSLRIVVKLEMGELISLEKRARKPLNLKYS